MDAHVVAGIWAGLLGGGIVLVISLLSPRARCPNCSAPLPKVRVPSSVKQAALGGWVCKACKTKVARSGAPL